MNKGNGIHNRRTPLIPADALRSPVTGEILLSPITNQILVRQP